jgi:putative sigma-54 modulation protein
MKITYTGRQVELAPAQLKKIEAQAAKVGKLLDGREQKEAHVILSLERHLHQAEVTVNYHNHQLVGVGSNADLFTAINSAIEKLEKQVLKIRTKWRDTKRVSRKEEAAEKAEPAEPARSGED